MQTAKTKIKILNVAFSRMPASYLTQVVKEQTLLKRLNLRLGDKDEFMLVTFGSEKPRKTESRSTKLDKTLKDGNTLTVNANVVPRIAVHS